MQRLLIVVWAMASLGTALPAASQAIEASPLECEVNGYDLIIRNAGQTTIPQGVAIDWAVRFSRSADTHMLEKDFEPGARVYLTGALGASYLEPGTPCTVILAVSTDEKESEG